MNADRIEKTLDEMVKRTDPGPPPKGAAFGVLLIGFGLGFLVCYLFFRGDSSMKYDFLTSGDSGVIWRVDHHTGEAASAFAGPNRNWNHVTP